MASDPSASREVGNLVTCEVMFWKLSFAFYLISLTSKLTILESMFISLRVTTDFVYTQLLSFIYDCHKIETCLLYVSCDALQSGNIICTCTLTFNTMSADGLQSIHSTTMNFHFCLHYLVSNLVGWIGYMI